MRNRLCPLRQKCRFLLARDHSDMDKEESKLPDRLRIFLFIASKFSSDQVRINATGDMIEEYEADYAERGKVEANKRLNRQIVGSILPLFYRFCFVKAIKAAPSRTKYILLSIKKNLVPTHAFPHLVFLLSMTLFIFSTQWQQSPLTEDGAQTTRTPEEVGMSETTHQSARTPLARTPRTRHPPLDVEGFRGAEWTEETADLDGDGDDEVLYTGTLGHADGEYPSRRYVVYVPRTRQTYSLQVVPDSTVHALRATWSPNTQGQDARLFRHALRQRIFN